MRTLTRLAAFLASFLGLLAPASALGDGDTVSGSGSAEGATILAQVQYGRPPAGLGSNDSNGCSYRFIEYVPDVISPVLAIRVINEISYKLFERTCNGTNTYVWVGQQSRERLALAANDRIHTLAPRPAVGLQPIPSLQTINIPTWFWTDTTSWRPISVTAWIPTPNGIAWATTTATPTRLRYIPGNGQPTATCTNSGHVVRESSRHSTVRRGDCAFTYTHGATDGDRTVPARLEIEWNASWRSNISAGGTLPSFTTSTTINVDIDEIHALTTS